MSWYSSLFGHYRFVGCHLNWNDDARRRLVSGHPCKITRQYLSYLTETVTLDEWMAKRSITPKPIARMVTKVSNVLHLTPKKK
uniref:Transposase n=1 Tax=Heterorhabditis bacteriophora TaxID=37862 RepID=A0A1I7WQ31_HETBA